MAKSNGFGNNGQAGSMMKRQGSGKMGGDGMGHMKHTPQKLAHQNSGAKHGMLPATKIVHT